MDGSAAYNWGVFAYVFLSEIPVLSAERDWYFNAEQPAPAPLLAHPEECAAPRIVLVTVPRVSRSCEHFRCPQCGAGGRTLCGFEDSVQLGLLARVLSAVWGLWRKGAALETQTRALETHV